MSLGGRRPEFQFFGQIVSPLILRKFGYPLVLLVFVIIEFWFAVKGNKALLLEIVMYFKE